MSQPPPIDYGSAQRPDGPRRGSVGRFFLGLAVGLGMSFVGWLALVKTTGGEGALFAALLLIAAKLAVGIPVEQKARSGGFLPGILVSIPLVPLIGLGILAALCGGFRL